MKDWKGCPDCWGTGLVGGFQAKCEEVSALTKTSLQYIKDQEPLQKEVRKLQKAVVRAVVQKVIRRVLRSCV